MDRRRFLAIGTGAAAAGVAVNGIAVATIQPSRKALPISHPDRPVRPGTKKRVAIVGGGLAGLSAAISLGKRGFDVHLFEAASHLGGKLGGWEIEALGRSFPMEHGFHGFFRQYYNVNDLLEEAGCSPDLVASPSYPILFASRAPEYFAPSTAPFPFNLMRVVDESKSLGFSDFLGIFPGLLRMMAYDRTRTFSVLDGISFRQYLRNSGVPDIMSDVVLEPFGNATMNHLDRLSAAEAVRFFHVYFFGNPEGLAFRFLARDVMTAVVDRIEALAVRNGVTLYKSTPVRRILREGQRVVGLEIPKKTTATAVDTDLQGRTIPVDNLSASWTALPHAGPYPIFVRRGGDAGDVQALLGRCTHMGCPVQLTKDGTSFICPCHGGVFDEQGQPRRGPPPLPLVQLPTTFQDGTYRVMVEETSRELVPADYVIVACDSTNARRLVETSDLAPYRWAEKVGRLHPADPYSVLRLWMNRPVREERPPFSTVHQYPYTDSLAIYSAFQEPYRTWGIENKASVIESHAYAIEPERLLSYEKLQEAMVEEIRQLLPELRNAQILHSEMMVQHNFTSFAPGVDAHRPTTRTGIPNLFAAGDWVRLPIPAFLMEAAVASGKIAANEVMESEGLRTDAVPHVDDSGPFA